MFPQNLFKMFEQEMLKGLEKGLEKGREEGAERGSRVTQVRMLGKLLERRFGERAERLDDLLALSFEQRERMEDLLFDAEDEHSLFEVVKRST